MKRYKLINDLPTFKAGDTFHIEADGCLYLDDECARNDSGHWSHHVMAYHKNTLARFPNILGEWFEEIPEPERMSNFDAIINDLDMFNERLRKLEARAQKVEQSEFMSIMNIESIKCRLDKLEGQK